MLRNLLKKIVAISLLATTLTACVPAALVLGAAVGGAIIYDNRSLKTIVSDKNITHQALVKIYNDSALRDKAHIVVTSFNRVVLIVGQAPTPELRAKAFELTQSIPNIRRIYNEVTVSAPTSEKRRIDDSWITTKVKSELLAKKGLHSTQMKVLTENGVVYLLGLVTTEQGDLAANVARRVNSVKKVVKLFEYLH